MRAEPQLIEIPLHPIADVLESLDLCPHLGDDDVLADPDEPEAVQVLDPVLIDDVVEEIVAPLHRVRLLNQVDGVLDVVEIALVVVAGPDEEDGRLVDAPSPLDERIEPELLGGIGEGHRHLAVDPLVSVEVRGVDRVQSGGMERGEVDDIPNGAVEIDDGDGPGNAHGICSLKQTGLKDTSRNCTGYTVGSNYALHPNYCICSTLRVSS